MISVDVTKSSEVRKAGDRSNSNVVFSKKNTFTCIPEGTII